MLGYRYDDVLYVICKCIDCLVVHSHVEMPEGSMQVLQDSDDDGENAAGGRLLHLLQIVDALNVVCHFPWTLVFSSSCSSPHSRRQKKEQMQSASTKRVMSSTLGVIVMRMLMP